MIARLLACAKPRATARCIRYQASSQLIRRILRAAWMLVCLQHLDGEGFKQHREPRVGLGPR